MKRMLNIVHSVKGASHPSPTIREFSNAAEVLFNILYLIDSEADNAENVRKYAEYGYAALGVVREFVRIEFSRPLAGPQGMTLTD